MNFYNENDPKAAEWLRSLIRAKLIPAGDVDTRSIADLVPADLEGYIQCHFFAGIGGWSRALELAQWSPDTRIWTGSCPCQPFSTAGKRKGTQDERHLWPEFLRLIEECKPPTVIGEQVASKAGRLWLSRVRADLEALGYGVGAADLCAAGTGAPHIRQRLFWVADANLGERGARRDSEEDRRPSAEPPGLRPALAGGLANAPGDRRQGDQRGPGEREEPVPAGGRRMGNPDGERLPERPKPDGQENEPGQQPPPGSNPGGSGFWSSGRFFQCLDGKARRIEPSVLPLAHGIPSRVAQLRGLGNAIVPQVAAEFLIAYMETKKEQT